MSPILKHFCYMTTFETRVFETRVVPRGELKSMEKIMNIICFKISSGTQGFREDLSSKSGHITNIFQFWSHK